MQLSRQGDYAIRAMIDLAQHHEKGPIHTEDIAKRQDIPKMYLSKIIQALAKAGLIRTVRGNKGGIFLNKKPAKITLFEVIEAVEGQIALNECLRYQGACSRETICDVYPAWVKIQEVFKVELSKHTIGKFAKQNGKDTNEAA